jgi:hypothetical protein
MEAKEFDASELALSRQKIRCKMLNHVTKPQDLPENC